MTSTLGIEPVSTHSPHAGDNMSSKLRPPAVWCCAGVAEGAVPVAEQGRKVRRMCDAYGWAEVDLVVGDIGDRFRRARDQHAQAGRTKGAAILDRKLRWLDQKAAALIELSTPWGS